VLLDIFSVKILIAKSYPTFPIDCFSKVYSLVTSCLGKKKPKIVPTLVVSRDRDWVSVSFG